MEDPINRSGRAIDRSSVDRASAQFQRFIALTRVRVADFATSWRDPARRARRRGNFFGGTVAALIAVPYGMALAVAIGLRPEAGLYTSIIGGAISGLISDAPVVVSGLSATVVPVLSGLVKSHGVGAALAAGALCGAIMIALGALRLGRFFQHLPSAVISAFTSGLGLIIVTSQLKAVLGVKTSAAGFDLGIIDDIWVTARVAHHGDPQTIAIAALVIGTMFLMPRWYSRVPASLVAVVLASLAPSLLGWTVLRVGELPDSFPHPNLQALSISGWSSLIYPAFTLAGLITINQLLTVVVTDRLSEVRGVVKFNRELIAQGAANVVCPFFGAPPGVAMLARTVASARAGAVSRWSVFAHSLILLLFLLPLRHLISHIPLAALAAVTVAVGLELISIERFRALPRMERSDALLFSLTFMLVVFSDLIIGVGAGSLIAALRRERRPALFRTLFIRGEKNVVTLNHQPDSGGKR